MNLQTKADWIRDRTIELHRKAPETRIASSLSAVEILTVLYYGNILKYDSKQPYWNERDRLIISKAHGAVSLYPILANLGFFNSSELNDICKNGSRLGAIPDCNIPGIEIVAGSLGHGLSIGTGIALALKQKKSDSKVFVLMGDGELFEGSVWEAIMFAGHHKLNNLILIIDNNKIAMLDYCRNIIDLYPLSNKFIEFKWYPEIVDGHNTDQLYDSLITLKNNSNIDKPKVLIANTIKGKGVPELECDVLCHVKCLK